MFVLATDVVTRWCGADCKVQGYVAGNTKSEPLGWWPQIESICSPSLVLDAVSTLLNDEIHDLV